MVKELILPFQRAGGRGLFWDLPQAFFGNLFKLCYSHLENGPIEDAEGEVSLLVLFTF